MFNVKSAVKNFAVQAVKTAMEFKTTVSDNKAELIRGSVLDPYNHPSYSAEVAAGHKMVAVERDRLQREIDALT